MKKNALAYISGGWGIKGIMWQEAAHGEKAPEQEMREKCELCLREG